MQPFETLAEIEYLAARFVACTLPCAEWTHRAHLTVGLWHAREYSPEEALARVREGIQRYNTTCGVENSATRGYHETLTRFYMTLIGRFLNYWPDCSDWLALTNRLLAEHGNRELPLRYYTRERLMSSEARAGWIEPDLQAL